MRSYKAELYTEKPLTKVMTGVAYDPVVLGGKMIQLRQVAISNPCLRHSATEDIDEAGEPKSCPHIRMVPAHKVISPSDDDTVMLSKIEATQGHDPHEFFLACDECHRCRPFAPSDPGAHGMLTRPRLRIPYDVRKVWPCLATPSLLEPGQRICHTMKLAEARDVIGPDEPPEAKLYKQKVILAQPDPHARFLTCERCHMCRPIKGLNAAVAEHDAREASLAASNAK